MTTASARTGEATDIDVAGRIQERAYARFRAGELNEAQYIGITAAAMSSMPERFTDFLEGYCLSRFGGRE